MSRIMDRGRAIEAIGNAIALFKAVPVEDPDLGRDFEGVRKLDSIWSSETAIPGKSGVPGWFEHFRELLKETVEHGFVLSPVVVANHDEATIRIIIDFARNFHGLSGSQANQTFHKSWRKVATSDMRTLVVEQLVHYISTYGFQKLGFYSDDTIFFPVERFNVPGIDAREFPLVIIKGLSPDELLGKVMGMLSSGIALKEDTVKMCVDLGIYLGISEENVAKIANKEGRAILYDRLGIVPGDPLEFLRLLLFKATGSALLVKSKQKIEAFHEGVEPGFDMYLQEYDEKHGFRRLASIFNRYKPFFIAMKKSKELSNHVNIISKLSKKYHEPMKIDLLNQVTAIIKKGLAARTGLTPEILARKLENASIFRKARLAWALEYRLLGADAIVYRVRNGRAFSTSFDFPEIDAVKPYLEAVRASIVQDLRQHLEGVTIYIPEGIRYALPASEKQFFGNIPAGSSIETGGAMVIGVHWKNLSGEPGPVPWDGQDRVVDLDLSIISTSGNKYGWDGNYRSDIFDEDDGLDGSPGKNPNILFSGDVTSAPGDGAAEAFRFGGLFDEDFLVYLNYYNFNFTRVHPIPFTLFVADSDVFGSFDAMDQDYIVDPNKVLIQVKSAIAHPEIILGLFQGCGRAKRFYFYDVSFGWGTFSRLDYMSEQARKYCSYMFPNGPNLNELLEEAGAMLQDTPGDATIDLSPENLTRESFIDLLTGKWTAKGE